ncbi:MAG: hypothetical protein OXF11_05140 [Deltaproteobacteria bacterium]|nr:hypothetical protein [Deltaproteobacteria bacterium]
MMGAVLLPLHIAAGATALMAAAAALVTEKGGARHVRAGRVYAASMALVCVSALPLAVLGSDVVLLLVAVFSFYFVFAGWRFARNASGRPRTVDWAATALMGLTSLAMWGYGATLWQRGDSAWITMAVFGAIAAALAAVDFRHHRAPRRSAGSASPGTSPTCWPGPSPPSPPWWWSTSTPSPRGWRGSSPRCC